MPLAALWSHSMGKRRALTCNKRSKLEMRVAGRSLVPMNDSLPDSTPRTPPNHDLISIDHCYPPSLQSHDWGLSLLCLGGHRSQEPFSQHSHLRSRPVTPDPLPMPHRAYGRTGEETPRPLEKELDVSPRHSGLRKRGTHNLEAAADVHAGRVRECLHIIRVAKYDA